MNHKKQDKKIKVSRVKAGKSSPYQQYTVRGVSSSIDQLLREQAKKSNLSLNDVVLMALKKGLGLNESSHDDLDHLIGSWVDDTKFDAAILEQRKIDKGLWD
jgi:hypothetical protein